MERLIVCNLWHTDVYVSAKTMVKLCYFIYIIFGNIFPLPLQGSVIDQYLNNDIDKE